MYNNFKKLGIDPHRILAIDWDGVIGVFPYPKDGERPIYGAIRGLKALLDTGWHVEIHSCGCSIDERRTEMIELLELWSRCHHIVFENKFLSFYQLYPDQINFATEKPWAKIYIDDRGLKFEGWQHLSPDKLNAFKTWWEG